MPTITDFASFNPMLRVDAHAMMVKLHSVLTTLGLTELQLLDSYDVAGDETQIPDRPTVTSGFWSSAWMYFEMTGQRQAENPVYIRIRINLIRTNNSTSINDSAWAYDPYIEVSGDTSFANPLGVGSYTSGLKSTSYTNVVYTKPGLGSFFSYSGDTLVLVLDSFSVSLGFNNNNGLMPKLFAVINRGADSHTLVTNGIPSSSQIAPSHRVLYREGGIVISSSENPFSRAMGELGLTEAGIPVVCPVYAPTIANGRFERIKGVYTIKRDVASSMAITEMDFSGAAKNYLHLYSPYSSSAFYSFYQNAALLLEVFE